MPNQEKKRRNLKWFVPPFSLFAGLLLFVVLLRLAQFSTTSVQAHPIEPPEGYPKLNTSIKVVSPTLASTDGATLTYRIELRNTGAYTAEEVTLTDLLPDIVSYNNDARASAGMTPTFLVDTLTWSGDVGFDQNVVISYSVVVSANFEGMVHNTAVISHSQLSEAISLTADSLVTDDPLLTIEKFVTPRLPGPNNPLTYTIYIGNQGQPATGLPITVTDHLPTDTVLHAVGPNGTAEPAGSMVTWTQTIDLDRGQTISFTFSVEVGDVPSGTVILNDDYQVQSALGQIVAGEPVSTTIVDPVLRLTKEIQPDPPGSNRSATYQLTVFNSGSKATGLVITDRVPAGVSYDDGGTYADGVVSWQLPELDSGQQAQVTFTVDIGDIMDVIIDNNDYGVCSAEGICQAGVPLASVVAGPTFEVHASLYPIAKKPGGGTGPVTPTLTVRNVGPGNAIDANALIVFKDISISETDLKVDPLVGTLTDLGKCGDKCVAFSWEGDLYLGEAVTFTTFTGQSTIGGAEGNIYSAQIVVSDTLGISSTEPVSATATGRVTHLANLIPTKSAPPVIGSGLLMTYTISVWNSALSTDEPPNPALFDEVPDGTTLVRVNGGGVSETVSATTLVSWTLPAMSPGDIAVRSYVVRVDDDLVSGTLLVNDGYFTRWYEVEDKGFFTNTGRPVTTTVRQVGLIDSYKSVTPTVVMPGSDAVLTYTVHVVNSGPYSLNNVVLTDLLPWQHSTYRRDASATAGEVVSDIVSIHWIGDLSPFSAELITFSVVLDPEFEGPITNTAVITHSSLAADLPLGAVTNVTDKPILRISKSASLAGQESLTVGDEILYTIQVDNLGQPATQLNVVDPIPTDTLYVLGSASPAAYFDGNSLHWIWPELGSGESKTFTFRVIVAGPYVVNQGYYAHSAEGVVVWGTPVESGQPGTNAYLPFVAR